MTSRGRLPRRVALGSPVRAPRRRGWRPVRCPLGRSSRAGIAVAAVTAALVLQGCSEPARRAAPDAPTSPAGDRCARDLQACARGSSIGDLVPRSEPTDPVGEPIRIGMTNQEASPAGSYTELSRAAKAAIAFVNRELGGLDGRPLELDVCDNGFSAEQSISCAQRFVEAGVPAVLGGVDVFGTGISVLGQNGVPYVGGIPISDESATSPTSFQWSGGTWGAAVAFADHIASSGAKRAAMVHPDFGPINEAAGMGRKVLDGAGVATTDVPYPITGTDLTPALQAAVAPDPDALIVLGADTMCRSAIDAARDLGITATMYYLGACASPTVTSQFPPEVLEGAYFNVEGPISADDPDTVLYGAVMERYARDVDAVGAATVAFRSTINLYRALRSIDARPITADAVRAALGSQVSTPSFMGHPSTCDHRQIEGLPAMCSPQQILVEMHDGTLRQRGTWVDVGAVLSR